MFDISLFITAAFTSLRQTLLCPFHKSFIIIVARFAQWSLFFYIYYHYSYCDRSGTFGRQSQVEVGNVATMHN